MEIKGIDISYCNQKIDFQKVKNSGISFVIVRTGYRTKTDAMFKSHIENALNAGLDVGVYCYCMAKNPAQARSEASHVLKLIKPYKLAYPVFYDIEDQSLDDLSKTKLTNIALAFLQTIKNSGLDCGIYANPSWLENKLERKKLTGFDIWLAHWTNSPEKKSRFNYSQTIWQWGAGNVDGVMGKVDMDLCFVDYPSITENNKSDFTTLYALNLREAPSLNSKKLLVIPCGASVLRLNSSIVNSDGYAWYKVRYRNIEGFCAAKYLKAT